MVMDVGDGDDNSRLSAMRNAMKRARAAARQNNLTARHYQEVDQAISETLQQLSLVRPRDQQDGGNSNQLQWTKPPHRHPQAEDLASAHKVSIERLRVMVEDHNGPLEDLMLEPSKRAELAGIFQGVGNDDEQLRQLLRAMQRARDTMADETGAQQAGARPRAASTPTGLANPGTTRLSSPTRKGMDITPLVRIRERLQHARKAVSQKNVTAEDYREVDQAISGALGKLSLLRRSDQDGINSNQVQWAKPVHRPQQVEDMASAHRQAIKRLQAMVEDHNGPLEDLMLEPSKRAELAGIFQGVGDEQLRQLLRDMARTKETMGAGEAKSAAPEMASIPSGLPRPNISPCREVTHRGWFPKRDLHYLQLPEGRTISLLQPVAPAFFGDVFHGVCAPPTNRPAFDQRQTSRYVAVKKSSLEAMRRYPDKSGFREVSVMQLLSEGAGHEHVMPLVEAAKSETHLYVVTPLCRRGNLLQNIDQGLGIEEHQAKRWFKHILLGMGYIHSKGICHRNFDAANVAITLDGRATVVMDFGMAQLMPKGAGGEVVSTRDQKLLSDIKYMAPEVYRREAYDGRQADIWAVGVTFFVCMFGRYPWDAPISIVVKAIAETVRVANLALIHARRKRPGKFTDYGVSTKAMDIISSMLVASRAKRPSSAENLTHHPFFVV